MKKILALALTLALVLALGLSTSAALPAGWKYVKTNGAGEANAIVNEDGALSLSWGNPDVYWANLAVGYDVSAFNGNYTATVDVYVPSTVVAGGNMITGCPVVAVNVDNVEANGWTTGAVVKLNNYEGHPVVGNEDSYMGWGDTWCVIEPFDNALTGTALPLAFSYYSDLGIIAGEWNTVEVIVQGQKVTYYINDVLAIDSATVKATGNYFVLGSNGDCGNPENLPSFKNLVIKSNNGSVADVTAFIVDALPTENKGGCGNKA